MSSIQDSWFNRCPDGETGRIYNRGLDKKHQFHCCKARETKRSTSTSLFTLYLASSVVIALVKSGRVGLWQYTQLNVQNEVMKNDNLLQLCFFFSTSPFGAHLADVPERSMQLVSCSCLKRPCLFVELDRYLLYA